MSSSVRAPRRAAPLWLVPALWTLALGLWGLSRQGSLWRDEAATWQVALRSGADIRALLGHVDAVHGLYYLLMHGLFDWFGPTTTTLRLPSVLAVAVAAACVAAVGERLAGRWAGLGGGMVLGLLPAVQFYLQEGRPYALVAAGTGVATLLLVTLVQGHGGWGRWAAYAGAVLCGALLNWFSLLVLPAHLVTLVWSGAGRRVAARWAVASAGAVAGALPLVLFTAEQAGQVSWIPPLTWHMLVGPGVLLALGALAALADRPGAGRLSVASVGLPLLAVPQLGLVAVSLGKPLFLDRYVLFSMLGLALLAGGVCAAAVRAAAPRFPVASRWLVPGLLVCVVAALLPQSLAKRSPSSRVDDVLAMAADVRRLKEPGVAVVFLPSARRDARQVSPGAFTGLRDIALVRGPLASGTLSGVEAAPDRIRAAMLAERRILLVTDAPEAARTEHARRERVKAAVLREHFGIVADARVRGRRVTLYERR
ncbi:glycosyltransferase family 39 protein [Streptomyces sp. NPDC013181]|uniref:glycosyltransferase family 39 protein n=1 Tax=Streptomyces sp. NPDC013181 TaxID=3364864 RepID=UPI0036BDFA36